MPKAVKDTKDITVNVRLNIDVVKMVDTIAEGRGVTRSDLIRALVDSYAIPVFQQECNQKLRGEKNDR